jgi:two-component system, response regulator
MMIENMLDIILVEDNSADEELTLDALRENNIANRVKVLRDGEEAVQYIFRTGEHSGCGICEPPALILLDLNLPKIDGIEILRRIRSDERTKAIPVVVLTSSSMDKDRIESYLGVNSYIVKPVDFDNFAHAVAQIGLYWAVLNKPPY